MYLEKTPPPALPKKPSRRIVILSVFRNLSYIQYRFILLSILDI